MDHLLPLARRNLGRADGYGLLPLTFIATSLRNLSISASQPALVAAPKLTEGGSEVEWVRAELRALTIRTSCSARGAQRTARPTFFCDWRFKSVPLRSPHGFADETYVGGKVRGMGRLQRE